MSGRLICVVFLFCQIACFGSSTSPYGSSNGHVGKKGPDHRHQDKDRPRISEAQTCTNDFSTRSNYIIRTTESLDNNAVFIDSIKVGSSEICIENCCEARANDGESSICDVAVFVNSDDASKNKDSNCFLFQCRFETGERNRCKFAEHDGYVSNMFGGFGEETEFPDRVRQQDKEKDDDEDEEIPSTKRPAPKITKSRVETVEDEDVLDEEEEHETCNEKQFQCDNGDCIRLSLLCDDYNDCVDFSDEKQATCDELEDDSEEAIVPPTNPPKPHTTINNNHYEPAPTPNIPESKEGDTIFSELAQQLHKEGARQKMKEQAEEDNPDGDDWDTSRDEDDPQDNPNEDGSERQQNQEEVGEDYDWRPRQQSYYGYNHRPNRPRPYNTYNYDQRTSHEEYRDYPVKQDEDQDNLQGEIDRKDHDDDDKSKLDEQNKGESEDSKQSKEDSDKTGKMEGKGEENGSEKWPNQHDRDDTNGSGEKEPSRPKQKGLESTKEDWYGKDQPDKSTVPGGSGRDYDYNKDNYHDYFGNYYDRNRYRGYPNRYRYPYGPGGDYIDYMDYNRQGNGRMPPPGRGGAGARGRGGGAGYKNRNWSQSRNQDGDFRNDDNDGESEEDELEEKLQGDDQDKKTNTADAPHSRRLRPGLYKIWRYMYGSSAADYATDYPPVAPGGQDKDDAIEDEEDTEDQAQMTDDDKEFVKIPTTNRILKTEQDDDDTPVEVLVMETQKSGPQSENPTSDQSSNSKTASKSGEVKGDTKTGTKLEGSVADSDVRVTDAQSAVTATAVLPLTIGLFLTLFLLLMMSCRLRYMNRRLRYGRLKTNNAHDADYLINGMYL